MELILHNHQRSMFSEKVRRVLAYKGLAWTDVQIPAIPPKTNFVPLTGGYRRMPVLQIGADIYCDSALVLRKLDALAPTPGIFPPGTGGAATMIADWADHRVAMSAILAVFPDYLPHVTPAFIADRTSLVPDFAPERVAVLAPHALAQVRQFAAMLDAALAAGPFVLGETFSAADASLYHVVWFCRSSPRVFAVIQPYPRVVAWMDRIAAFATPDIVVKSDAYPLEVARQHVPEDIGGVPVPGDDWAIGDQVTVGADDYGVERVAGEIVKLTPVEVAVRQVSPALGEIAIHFPRVGFSIRAHQPAGA